MTDTRYLLDNAAPQTQQRFTSLEALYDPTTVGHLNATGITPGWHCLEVGAGGGSVARWLAQRVGPTGSVLATDLDPRWLPARDQPNLEIRCHDITTDPLPDAEFDLAHERLLLIHLPQRAAALARMVDALKPGGWLVVEDYDLLSGECCPQERTPNEQLANRVFVAFYTLLARRGADLPYGQRLPRLLREAGLTQVHAEGRLVMGCGGSPAAELMAANIAQVAGELVDSGLLTSDEVDSFLELMGDPGFAFNLPLMISARGQRPPR